MSLIPSMIALADSLTKSFGLQADVMYWAYKSQDGAGARTYASGVRRTAVYTRKQKQVRTFSGEIGVCNAQLMFLDATAVSEFDRIVTPVGGVLDATTAARDSSQPIIGTDSFVDESNGAVMTEIYLG